MLSAEITGFLHYKCIEVGLSPRTLEAYERDLAHFSSWRDSVYVLLRCTQVLFAARAATFGFRSLTG